MLNRIAQLFSYLVYGSVFFNVAYPATEYQGLIDNFHILYAITGTVGCVILFLFLSALVVVNFKIDSDDNFLSEHDKGRMGQKVKKLRNAMKGLRLRVVFGQILSVSAGLLAFIVLSKYYVGSLMLIGAAGIPVMMGLFHSIANKIEKRVNEGRT